MKAALLGADCLYCQIPALRAGFTALGHQHSADIDGDTSFVFVGNPPFEPYLDLARSREKKIIFNVLDVPLHCREWPEFAATWPAQLALANRVTCISQSTQRDLLTHCGVQSEVIYYPMKPVRFDETIKRVKGLRVLLVGRVNDPNKRVGLTISALIRAGFEENEIGVVGPENPRFGQYFGLVPDDMLNTLYNSVDYVMMLSIREGIGLPAIEAACCGAIPIVAPDLTTFDEFWVQSPLGLHYQNLHSIDKVAMLLRALEDDPKWRAEVKQDMLGYAALAFRPKFEAKAVAARLIEIYHTL